MRLLITVQTVDRDGDPLMGFFHGWLLAFAPHFEHIHVICLRKGRVMLPHNVTVHSLGKEDRESRLGYIVRFYRYLWKLRGSYDIVFSHMNPHYIALAGWYWRWKRLPILFWRNHAKMNTLTRIAAWYAARVFYTSPHACTSVFPHAVQMPVGIDTEKFTHRAVPRNEVQVLLLGRLSPVKHPELFMETAALSVGAPFQFISYGSVPQSDGVYEQKLRDLSRSNVTFRPGLPNDETPNVYAASGVYINCTREGSMDKTVLEAAACGAIPLVCNTSFKGHLPDLCILEERTPECLRDRITHVVGLPQSEKDALRVTLRQMVVTGHSLKVLTEQFVAYCRELV